MELSSYNHLIRALEARVLFDGAVLSDALQAATDADFQPTEDNNSDTNKALITESEGISEKELVFIDSALPDYSTLVNAAGDVEIHVINASEDGLNQIAEILQGRRDIDVIHIIGHGAQGVMTLGETTLGKDNLSYYSTQLDRIGQSLSSNGDLLLYGCNIAEGDSGKAFVEEIAAVTKADVAASDDTTGSGSLGGDWQLEYATGIIEAASITAENYTGSLATPVISGLSSSTYTEQAPAYIVDSNVSFSGGSNYSGGYIEFDLSSQNSSDRLTLATDSQASTVNGRLTIVGSTVYLGNGSVATVVGSVDSTYNGQNGQKLRVNFSNSFENNDFSTGSNGSTQIVGWTTVNQQVKFGTDTIAGWATPVDNVWPTNKSDGIYTDQNTPTTLGTLTTALSSTQNDGGGFSVQMESSGMTTLSGYDIVRGPYIYSNSTVALAIGDTVSFEWQAQGSSDAYDVFGYILDVNTGYTKTILNQTGNSSGASTTWATESITVSRAGDYRFVFVAGTYDYSGGLAAGARLYIDDVIVTLQNPPATVNDSHVSEIARRLMYSNTSDAPPVSKTLTVTAQNSALAGANTGTSSATINIVQVNDDPGATGLPTDIGVAEDIVSYVNLSAINLTDVDSASGDITLTLSASAGVLQASGANNVTVAGSGSDTLTLTGSISEINTFINNQNAVKYLSELNVNGDNAAVLTLTVNDGGNTGSGGGNDIVLGTINLDIQAKNDAPVASGSSTLSAIDEDALAPVGDTVGNLFSNNFSDVLDAVSGGSSANTLAGIAIVGYTSDSAKGQWQYNKGSGWQELSAITGDSAAFTLKAVDQLRFLPTANFNGSAPALVVRLIDSSASVISAATLDVSSNGGSTAYSSATVALSHSINPVNDDPGATGLPTDIGVAEDIVSYVNLSAINLTDVDSASGDITLTLSASAGVLQASGANNVTVAGSGSDTLTLTGSISEINAFIDNQNAVQYLSALNANGDNAAVLTLTVNDGGNTGSGGGNDIVLGAINLDIQAKNDAPVASGSAILSAIDEDAPAPEGDTVGNLFSNNFSDALDAVIGGSSANTLAGVAITSHTPDLAKGQWQYNKGSEWQELSAITGDSAAFTLKAVDQLRFLPTANFNGSAPALVVRLIDSSASVISAATIDVSSNGGSTAYSGTTVALSHSINPVNDAPQQEKEIADQFFLQGERVNFVIDAGTFVDIDSEVLTYSAIGLPDGLVCDAAEGTVSGYPKVGGLYTVTITASDGELSVDANFNIDVTPVALSESVTFDSPDESGSNEIVNTESSALKINEFGLIGDNNWQSELLGNKDSKGSTDEALSTEVNVNNNGQVLFTTRSDSENSTLTAKNIASVKIKMSQDGLLLVDYNSIDEGSSGLTVASPTLADGKFAMQIKDKIGGSPGVSYTAVMADGTPLPGWIEIDSKSGLITGEAPQGVQIIDLKIISNDSLGNTQELYIKLDLANENLDSALNSTELPSASGDFELFSNQIVNELESNEQYGSYLIESLSMT